METNWFRWIFAGESNKSQDKLASRHEGTCVIVAQTEAAVLTMQDIPDGTKVIVHVEHLGACMPNETLLIGCPVVLMKKWKRLWNLESERAQTKTRMFAAPGENAGRDEQDVAQTGATGSNEDNAAPVENANLGEANPSGSSDGVAVVAPWNPRPRKPRKPGWLKDFET